MIWDTDTDVYLAEEKRNVSVGLCIQTNSDTGPKQVEIVPTNFQPNVMTKPRKEWETDRDVARRPKKKQFYCWSCDMALVGEGAKCKVCGNRQGTKREKKARTDD